MTISRHRNPTESQEEIVHPVQLKTVCVLVCVCAHVSPYILLGCDHVCMYLFVCVCVCVRGNLYFYNLLECERKEILV